MLEIDKNASIEHCVIKSNIICILPSFFFSNESPV